MQDDDRGLSEALTQAQATIARQQEEIHDVRRMLESERFVGEVRASVSLAAAANTIAAPVTHSQLLGMIVETAAHIIDAQAASLLLVDEQNQELVFEVTLGQKASDVKKIRVPVGHGIAGLVAVSGQPMATSGGQHDPRQAADIAERVGYTPETILCMPLFHHDRVIGVLELLDKRDAQSFTPADMDALGLFANQAAVAIELSRTQSNLTSLIAEALIALGGGANSLRQPMLERARILAAGIENDAEYRWALDVASLVQEISKYGENERQACHTIVRGFADYLRARSREDETLGGTL
jgi:GAF domain-containing protein